MDWFTLAVVLGSAVMIAVSALFIYLFASEFFMQNPYHEWAVIAVGMVVVAISIAAYPFVSGVVEQAVAAVTFVGSLGMAAGFVHAYRRSAGGI